MKKIILLFFTLLPLILAAQTEDGSAEWSASVTQLEGVQYEVVFEARITPGWHMYDLGPYELPMATVFDLSASRGVELVGKVRQLDKPTHYFDDMFGFEVGYFEGTARFAQIIEARESGAILAAEIDYQVCSDEACIPGSWDFRLDIAKDESATAGAGDSLKGGGSDISNEDTKEGGSLWSLILEAMGFGLLMILMPCVFPMVPMTVSMFLKESTKGRGIFKAGMFGLFIVGLYTLPVALIIVSTWLIGGDAVTADIFNWLSTHWIPNVLFFVVFMIFAASFFGAFEIVLPSKLVNRADKNSDKGGLLGVFFLALTLVLVSFACTGPIVGSAIIQSTSGEFWRPVVTMFAMSVTFAVPFVLLAIFPSFLNKLKSGNWMNSIKVVFGFLEVALAFKFLSIADQTYHWGILDREVYLVIWIVVFSLMGFYLLGKIKFRFDGDVKYISVPRLSLVILTFSFVAYMIPGLWGAPLKALSGYLPPISSQDFVIDKYATSGGSDNPTGVRIKDNEFMVDLVHGLVGFDDYERGMAYAREVGKPLLLDFTGLACTNCREMEVRVWSDEKVLEILREDYVMVALYADDKKRLPKSEWVTTPGGKVLKDIGKVNSYFVNTRFRVSSQPAYILLDNSENILAPIRGYNLNIPAYVEFLKSGLEEYAKRR